MKRRLYQALMLLVGLALLLGLELFALTLESPREDAARRARANVVRLTGLPDLALTTGAPGLRHRSLAGLGAARGDDPELALPFPAVFVFAPAGPGGTP